ncbi:hypothetical protein OSB04_016429 [Centaurea solstitialis]|uniref:THH1/TOM1/TOM3 domain-containing protein n=1 Tax=Centaurea solstitialis TaxID=347529 RepID=A0AA38T2J8_9ASTR|nr:hypothetical protein OSB04_016429 [Centaurea solstitialis]
MASSSALASETFEYTPSVGGIIFLMQQRWNEIGRSQQLHEGVFYALCAAYALVALIALVQLVRIQLRVPEYGWTTQKVFHLMNFVVNGLRAIEFGFYWSVFHNKPKELDMILLDLPGLLFFSTYTLLVLFWAEIYHQARSLPADKLRPAYFIVNGLVYFLQICIWIYMRFSKGPVAVEVAQLFFAVISLSAAMGFVIYGGRLFVMLRRFPIESRGRQKKLHEVAVAAFNKDADIHVLNHPILDLVYYLNKIPISDVFLANRHGLDRGLVVSDGIDYSIYENGDAELSNPRPRGPNKDRRREEGHDKLVADYFFDNPMYNDEDFKRRFRISRRLFVRIVSDLEREFEYFKQQWDARGVKGFSPLQKCTSAIRQLAYETASDSMDEYLRMGETTSRECLKIFLSSDIQAIYALHEQQHDLPGMLGSIDCMHWEWKNCPVAWRGQFHRGDHEGPTVILEAVASYDEWIWHAFFGVPGATNDIIVVNQSPIFNDLFENKAPDSSFIANGTHYNHGCYLVDGIYPEWTTFVKAFRYPTEVPRLQFTTRQESARKDIERTFATLKSKWHVVARPARVWSRRKLQEIMYTCIILHNMTREDEGFSHDSFDPTAVLPSEVETNISEEERANNVNFVKNQERHANLRADLSQHLWDSMPHN